MAIWQDKGGKLAALTRCPICESPMKNWHQYRPNWTMVQICFKIIEMLQGGAKHIHIKDKITKVPIEHRDHTLVGEVVGNYAKMMYLGLITRCTEEGDLLEQFTPPSERDDEGLGQFTITPAGYAFVMGNEALQPGVVRVKNKKIISVPENEEERAWVHDVVAGDRERHDTWLDAKGKFVLTFPQDLLPPLPDIVNQER